MYQKCKSIIFTGGGSGGHLIPGISLAEALQSSLPDWHIIFSTPGKKIDLSIIEKSTFPSFINPTRPFKANIYFWENLFRGFWHSEMLIRKIKPSIIIGLGGYGSLTCCISGLIHKVPVFLLEGNMIAGKVVRWLAPFIKGVFAHKNTKGIPRNKLIPLGIPLRNEILEISQNFSQKSCTKILIMGGSQGSQLINENFCACLKYLSNWNAKVEFIHIWGSSFVGNPLVAEYQKHHFSRNILVFAHSAREMYENTNIVIARAGASTIAEITALGIPSILIPFENSADKHQQKNAWYLEKKGAAKVIQEKMLSPQKLAIILKELLTDNNMMHNMARAAKLLGKKEATKNISQYIIGSVS